MPACLRCATQLAPGAGFCPHCGTAVRAMSEPATWEGQLIDGRYAIRHRLGAGGSGTVYLADHIHLGKKVALKALHKDLITDEMALERFRREATMVGALTNPHIVQILDYGRLADGRVYLAMEYLEGESLESMLLRLGRVSVEQTIDVLRQACEALGEAHSIGYVHRDLRPKNLFLTIRPTASNFLKVLDFGLAKAVDANQVAASTSLGLTFGDPRYMSPEQAKGAQIDRRSDLYQLGCVAYEMLTGAPPFAGSGVFEVLAKHANATPAPIASQRADVPPQLEQIIMRLLAKAPEARFATAFQLADALRPLGQEADARPEAAAVAPASHRHTVPAGNDAVTAAAVTAAVTAMASAAAPAATSATKPLGTSQAWYRAGEQLAEARGLDDSSTELPSSVSIMLAAGKQRRRRLVALSVLAASALAMGVWLLFVSKETPRPAPNATVVAVAPSEPSPAAPLTPDMPTLPLPSPPAPPDAATSAPTPAARPTARPTVPQADLAPTAVEVPSVPVPPAPLPVPVAPVPENTEDVPTLLQRAEADLANGDYDSATRGLRAVLARAPSVPLHHVLMGEALLSQGDFEGAADAFKTALQLDPNNARARRGYLTAESRIAPPIDDEGVEEPGVEASSPPAAEPPTP